jgi:hypothetical protein
VSFAPLVTRIVQEKGVTQILDYGAGKQRLREHIPKHIDYRAYDPAVEAISAEPEPAEMVTCIDVLEHIEPECLDAVLDHLASLTQKYAFLTVHTGPAMKVLPDGRNAHLTQQPSEWWVPKLRERWRLRRHIPWEAGFVIFAEAL